MPGAQKRGNYWYWYFDHKGHRMDSSNHGVKYLTKAHALREMRIFQSSLIRRGYLFGDPEMDVYSLCIRYFLNHIKVNCKPYTISRFRSIMGKYILPIFGGEKVAVMRTERCTTHVNWLLKQGLSPAYVATIVQYLRAIWEWGIKQEILFKNPWKNVTVKRGSKQERPVLAYSEIIDFLTRLPLRDRAICGLAGLAGLRRGEVFGLQWGDLRNDEIHLQRQVQFGEEVGLKSQAAYRPIPMITPLVKIIADYRASHKVFSKWVFPATRDVNKAFNAENYNKIFTKLLETNGIPHMRFHDLRHSFVTWVCNEAGISIDEVKSLSRHLNQDTVERIYRHLTKQKVAEINSRFKAYNGRINENI